ncbi:MAG: hypothetical protein KDD82_31650 [Planctomycetes bacterium]|nr:hypothetical protein [Planctomycetota bacterium]
MPVALDCWDYRRAKGPGGEFFRSFAVPAELNRVNDDGNRSLQGHYVVDPGGRLLAAHNRRGAQALRELTARALAAFRPQEWALPTLDADSLGRTPPPGARVLNVYTRVVDWTEALQLSPSDFQRDQMVFNREATGLDHLWVTRAELDALCVREPRPGAAWQAPASLARRLARFHLVDDVRGEPPHYRRSEVRAAELRATVRETSPEGWVTVALSGRFELDAKDDPSYPRWFRGSLDGALEYHLLTAELRRFELLAEGQTEGSGRYTPGAPEGPYRLRVACELPPDAFAVDVPPQGSRSVLDYLVP